MLALRRALELDRADAAPLSDEASQREGRVHPVRRARPDRASDGAAHQAQAHPVVLGRCQAPAPEGDDALPDKTSSLGSCRRSIRELRRYRVDVRCCDGW